MTDPTGPTGPTRPTDPTEASSPTSPTSPTTPTIAAEGDDRVAVLAAYLRSNSGRFTDEALAGAARAGGYSDAEIAAARMVADPTTDAGPPETTRRVNRGVVAAVAILYVIALYGAIAIAGSFAIDLNGIAGGAGLLGGIVAWALLRDVRPSLAQGIGCGVLLAVALPVIVLLVILGICLVAGTGGLTV
jgi:hypothetical protein